MVDRQLPVGQISTYAYGLYRDFEDRLPIPPTTPAVQGGIVTFYRFSPGGGARYLLPVTLAGRERRLSAGIDVQYQDDNRRRFSNDFGTRGPLGLEAFVVDAYPVNDANTADAPGYVRLTLRGGYDVQLGRWRIGPFVGFDNLLDQSYDGTVRINATGGRYFEPAPGFSVYGGITVGANL